MNFYKKVQLAFLKIAKLDKKRCFVIENSEDSNKTEKLIQEIVLKKINK